MKTIFHDEYGFLHPTRYPHPLASENGPLFTGMELTLKFMNGKATPEDCRNFFASISHLHGQKQKGIWSKIQKRIGWDWQVTPISDRYDFSKDNWRGIWMAICCIRFHYRIIYLEHKKLIDSMPILHKQLLHPIDFFIVLRAKYGIKVFDKIIQWDFLRAAKQTHKKRGERLIAKTEGKFMALCLIYAFNWYPDIGPKFSNICKTKFRKYPLPVNNKNVCLIYDKEKWWSWYSWENIFLDYFPDKEHPLNKLIKDWEDG